MRTFTIALLFTMMATILVWSEGASATDTILLTIDFGGECAAKTQAGDLKAGPVKLELTQNGNTFTCGHYKIQRQSSAAGEARLEAARRYPLGNRSIHVQHDGSSATEAFGQSLSHGGPPS